MNENKRVSIRDYNILGSNFYWNKYAAHGLTKEDIITAGVVDDQVYVREDIIQPLLAVDKELQEKGWRLYIKEGLRSEELYKIIYKRRVEKYGKEETDSIFNMEGMPHAKGDTVDVAIWDPKEDKEVYLRKGDDGTPALFIDFYKDRKDEEGQRYQELQEYLIKLMAKHGFRIGTKREYFHFDYRPGMPKNYPVS